MNRFVAIYLMKNFGTNKTNKKLRKILREFFENSSIFGKFFYSGDLQWCFLLLDDCETVFNSKIVMKTKIDRNCCRNVAIWARAILAQASPAKSSQIKHVHAI